MKTSLKCSMYLLMAFVCIACVSIGRHTVKTPTKAQVDSSKNVDPNDFKSFLILNYFHASIQKNHQPSLKWFTIEVWRESGVCFGMSSPQGASRPFPRRLLGSSWALLGASWGLFVVSWTVLGIKPGCLGDLKPKWIQVGIKI